MGLYYQDDYVTLYHGDCLTEHREWLDADVLVTDPPYGMNWLGGAAYTGGLGGKRSGKVNVSNDSTTEARDRCLSEWGESPAIVFGTWRVERPERVTNRLIWHKARNPPGVSGNPWYPNDEEIYVIGKGFRGKPQPTVYTTNEWRSGVGGVVHKIGHPTPKPIELMEALVVKCPSGTIADPFAGSGATLIAARNLGRKSIGVELEERYCEIIATRLDQQVIDFGALM